MNEESGFERRVRRWWIGFTIALFLLLPLDLLTTFVSVSRHGLGVEANPVMWWLLNHGILVVTVAHLAVIVAAVVGFDRAIGAIRRSPAATRGQLSAGVDAWVAFVVAGGVVLVVNNLLAIF